MKKCLTYMSRFWGPAKIWLVLWIIFIAVFKKNAFIMMALIYTANAMSLSIYGADLAADTYFAYGRGDGRLTLSLPMSRKTIYDTRMYMAGGIYLISLILSVFPFVKSGLVLEYFMSAGTLIFGHIICGLCIRKPHLHGIAGLPAFMLLIVQLVCDWVESIQYQFHQIEKNRTVLSFAMVLYIIMFAIDIYVWLRERRIFIYGNPKGNVIRKEKIRKDEKYYGKEKKKMPGIMYLLIPFAVVIGNLLFPLLVIGIFVLGYKTAKVEVHDNVNDYLKYHTGEQAEEVYRYKWDMDETIWPASITKDMNVDEYKMVYYDPFDAQFLGYLTVRYDKENYEKEVMRLKEYQSTEYLGYYGVTGFEDYELLAMYADSYQGFVYALTDGVDKIIYVEIIFCNHFMDLDYEKYIPEDYLPKGFNAKMNNPYQKKWEKENGLDNFQLF